jgi:hypothetical protein
MGGTLTTPVVSDSSSCPFAGPASSVMTLPGTVLAGSGAEERSSASSWSTDSVRLSAAGGEANQSTLL